MADSYNFDAAPPVADDPQTPPQPDYQAPQPATPPIIHQRQTDPEAEQVAQQRDQRAQQQDSMVKAEDLSTRGVPFFNNPQNQPTPVIDESGQPLTKFDQKNNIAWDSQGQPRSIQQPAPLAPHGTAPTLGDPFSGIPDWTSKTGDVYQRRNGLPWKWVGSDPAVQEKAKAAAVDKLNQQTSTLMGGQITQMHAGYNQARVEAKASQAKLIASGVQPFDPKTFQPVDLNAMDGPTLSKHIEDSFNLEYAQPEANDKGWGGQLTADAQARRDEIDQQKAAAMSAAQQHIQNVDRVNQYHAALTQLSSDREQVRQQQIESLNQRRAEQGLPPVNVPQITNPLAADTEPDETQPDTVDGTDENGEAIADAAVGLNGGSGQPASGQTPAPGTHNPDETQAAPAPVQAQTPEAQAAVADAKAGKKPYTVDEKGQVQFDPHNITSSISQAAADGLIDKDKAKAAIPEMQKVQDAIKAREQLIKDAGQYGGAKALATGAVKGAAFAAGAPAGAGVGAEVGALGGPLSEITVPAGAIIGGLISGTLSSMAAKKAVEKLGDYNDTIKSFSAASDLHPYYDAAGNILSFGVGLPKAAMEAAGTAIGRLEEQGLQTAGQQASAGAGANIINSISRTYSASGGGLWSTIENLAKDAAIRKAGGANAATIASAIAARVGGAALANVAIDTAINEGAKALGIQDHGETAQGAIQNALIGAFLSGHGLNFEHSTNEQMANIIGRAHDAMKAGTDISEALSPKEFELWNKFTEEMNVLRSKGGLANIDPAKVQVTADQALQGNRPYGVSAVKIDPGVETASEAPASQPPALPSPEGGGEKPVEGRVVEPGGAQAKENPPEEPPATIQPPENAGQARSVLSREQKSSMVKEWQDLMAQPQTDQSAARIREIQQTFKDDANPMTQVPEQAPSTAKEARDVAVAKMGRGEQLTPAEREAITTFQQPESTNEPTATQHDESAAQTNAPAETTPERPPADSGRSEPPATEGAQTQIQEKEGPSREAEALPVSPGGPAGTGSGRPVVDVAPPKGVPDLQTAEEATAHGKSGTADIAAFQQHRRNLLTKAGEIAPGADKEALKAKASLYQKAVEEAKDKIRTKRIDIRKLPTPKEEPPAATHDLPEGVEYQGKDQNGLHHFKNQQTNDNFSIKRDEMPTHQQIEAKAAAVRKSFEEKPQETIKSPASRINGNVYEGAVHSDAMENAFSKGEVKGVSRMSDLDGLSDTKATKVENLFEHGYTTSEGRFVGRDEGARIAKRAGQSTKESDLHADDLKSRVDAAAHEAATSPHNDKPEPTREQIGKNAELGHPKISGMDISIENPSGSTRRDVHNEPPKWTSEMKGIHYGYLKGTVGHDKDHVDVMVKQGTPEDYAGAVFVVNQNHPDGSYDEAKAVLGASNQVEARQLYLAQYPQGQYKNIRNVVEMPIARFKEWAYSDEPKKGPANAEAPKKDTAGNQGADRTREESELQPVNTGLDAQSQRQQSAAAPVTAEESRASLAEHLEAAKDDVERLGLKFQEGDTEAPSGFDTNRQTGELKVNHANQARAINTVNHNGGNGKAWQKDGLAEELTHSAQVISAGPEFNPLYERLYKMIPKEAKPLLQAAYPDTKDTAGLAAEYERMVIQVRNTGRTTEHHHRPEVMEPLMPFLQGQQPLEMEDNIERVETLTVAPAEAPKEDSRGKYSVYQRNERWLVQMSEKRGFGDGIFPTEDAARKYADIEKNREDQRAQTIKAEADKKEVAEQETKKREAKVTEYLDATGAEPMQRGKLKTVLMARAAKRSGGKLYDGTRAEVAEQLLKDGFQPKIEQVDAVKELTGQQSNRMDNRQQAEHQKRKAAAGKKNEYRLEHPDGRFFDVTKAEHDYAEWLGNNPGIKSPPKLTEPPTSKAESLAKEAFQGLFASSPYQELENQETGTTPIIAVKLDDGAVLFSKKWSAHIDAYASLPTRIGDKVVDGGFIINGKWKPGGDLSQGLKEGETLRQYYGDALAASIPFEKQSGLPKDRRAKFMELADAMDAERINTPEAVARFLDRISGGKARRYSQALWDFIGIADPEKRGTHDWGKIFHSLESGPESSITSIPAKSSGILADNAITPLATVKAGESEPFVSKKPRSDAKPASQLIGDSATIDANKIADLPQRFPGLEKGFSTINIKSQKNVMREVLRLIGEHPQVFDAVVSRIPVDMMDNLGGKEFSPKVLFHNQAVFVEALAGNSDRAVAGSMVDEIIRISHSLRNTDQHTIGQDYSTVTPPPASKEAVAEAPKGEKRVAPKTPKEEPKKSATEDSGAELTYNKRNRILGGIKWSDIADKNPALQVLETQKPKVFPKPNYAEMIEGGMPEVAAHIVKQVYDAISTKPLTGKTTTDVDLQNYIQGVNRVMNGVITWANDKEAFAAWTQTLYRQSGSIISMMAEAKKNRPLDTVFPTQNWKDHKDELRIIGGNKVLAALQPGTQEAKKASKEIAKGWPGKLEAWQKQGWAVRQTEDAVTIKSGSRYVDGAEKPVFYADVNGRAGEMTYDRADAEAYKAGLKPWILTDKYGRIKGQFDDREAAVEKARESVKRETKGGSVSEKGISVEMAKRTGPPRRAEGQDITSDQLREAYGFKGINFGNWVKGKSNEAERQLHLNHTYDSFMDLANILDVPPKAMSLNGMLGVAIGAQGSGAHAAHFVPGVNEINLTRTGGAGSLAHEFAHAIDHYFATQAGIARGQDPFLSEHVEGVNPNGEIKRSGKLEKAFEGIRPEVVAKFKAIVEAMNYRMQTPEEVEEADHVTMARSLEHVASWLKAIRRDFEAAGRVAGLGAGAKPVNMEVFDKLADQIKALDLGDPKVQVGNRLISPRVDELRDLYKAATGRTYSLDQIKSLQANVDHAAYKKSQIDQGVVREPMRVATSFSEEASKLDKEKQGKRYWSTNLEKFARAFDAFVSDKLEEEAQKNTYLSHAGRTGETVPTGDERKAINGVFQALVDEIETEETERGVSLYASNPSTPEDQRQLHQLTLIASKRTLRPAEQEKYDRLRERAGNTEVDRNTEGLLRRSAQHAGGEQSEGRSPDKPLSKIECGREVAIARRGRDSEIKRLGLRFKNAGSAARNGLATDSQGTILYNLDALARQASHPDIKNWKGWISAAVDEELLHVADDKTLAQKPAIPPFVAEDRERIWSALPDATKDAVKRTYSSTARNEQLGAEYIRMLAQVRSNRPITEQFRKDQSLLRALLAEDQPPEAEQKVAEMLNLLGWDKDEPLMASNPVSRFYEDDMKKPVANAAGVLGQAMRQIAQVLNPMFLADEEGKQVGYAAREMGGSLAHSSDVAQAALRVAHKVFDRSTNAENLAFMYAVEEDLPLSGKLGEIKQALREMLDEKRDEALDAGALRTFIENYWPHIWEKPDKAKTFLAGYFGKKPMRGSGSFRKQRKIPTMREGIGAGLIPASYNPVDLVILKRREMDKWILAHHVLEEYKAKGQAKFVRSTERAPDGWEKINDPMFTVHGPREIEVTKRNGRIVDAETGEDVTPEDGIEVPEGTRMKVKVPAPMVMGHYYMPADLAGIINNYLSPGLREKSDLFKSYLGVANVLNQFQLGLSFFHLGFTSVDTMVSELALALEHLFSGHPLRAAAALAHIPVAPFTTALLGNKVLKEWFRPGSQGAEIAGIMNAAVAAGGRAGQDEFYKTHATKAMKAAFKSGNLLGGILRIPFAAVEQAARPIMEKIVPMQKMGVFARMMQKEMADNPNMTHDQLRAAAAKAWDSVDNRLGQVVYDNLFWNKIVKDLGMASVRSLGWNMGTFREIGGGLFDLIKGVAGFVPRIGRGPGGGNGGPPDLHGPGAAGDDGDGPVRIIKGRKPEFTHRMAYVLALPMMVGLMGAILMKLLTGKDPKELKDYFYPQIGGKDLNGSPQRISLPSYMKDIYAYYQHPGQTLRHKLHPLLSVIGDMLANEDYYGVAIRNSDDKIIRQAMDELKYVGKQFEPFSARGIRQLSKAGASPAKMILPFFGITPAPAEIDKSPALTLASRIIRDNLPSKPISEQQQERRMAKSDLERQFRNGNYSGAGPAIRSGTIKPQDVRAIQLKAQSTPLQNAVRHMGVDDAKRVLALATTAERREIGPMVMMKESRQYSAAQRPIFKFR